MPMFAHVAAVVPCPECGSNLVVGGRVGFQWGYCADPLHGGGPDYQVGDTVRWRPGTGGQSPAWAYFPDGGGNLGDPSIASVLVRAPEFDNRACLQCGHRIAGIGVLIRDGAIADVRAYTEGLPVSDVSVIGEDGKLTPRSDWDDRVMVLDGLD